LKFQFLQHLYYYKNNVTCIIMNDERKIINTLKTISDWKKFALRYLEEHPNEEISITDIFSLYETVPKMLLDAIERLINERVIESSLDDEGKIWIIYRK